jgi:uncharacterized membrane-anchored protein YhcB (DUF1043 family)
MSFDLVVFAAALVLVAVVAFVVGRKTSPERSRADSIQTELDKTKGELDQVRGEINGHFEKSGQLFGRLAEDYRALYEHFSDSATKLGLLEGEAESLLELTNPHLLPEAESEAEAEGEVADEPKSRAEPDAEPTEPRAREARA